MENVIVQIREALKESVDPQTLLGGQRFFKEKIKMYGVKIPEVNKIGKRFFEEIKTKPKNEIFELCEQLWQSGYLEEGFIASEWTYALHDKFEEKDFAVLKSWIENYVDNWATCDTLCNHSLGAFLEKFPEFISKLKSFAKSENSWMRRAAAVTLIIPARKGKFLSDIFEIADTLLLDQNDLVQKGYGWMLKAASEAYPQEVFDYVMSKRTIMPRTSFRYAIEKLPKEMKAIAMEKK